jgi:hypothetical protein
MLTYASYVIPVTRDERAVDRSRTAIKGTFGTGDTMLVGATVADLCAAGFRMVVSVTQSNGDIFVTDMAPLVAARLKLSSILVSHKDAVLKSG